MSSYICKVAIENATYSFDKLYSYAVPDFLEKNISEGIRVIVPFSRGNKTVQGVVFSVEKAEESGSLKKIIACIDEEPILLKEQLALAVWLKENTFCTYFDAVKVLIPSGLGVKLSVKYKLVCLSFEDENLKSEEKEIARFILESKKGASLYDVQNKFPQISAVKVLKSLEEKNIIEGFNVSKRVVGDETMKMVRLLDFSEDELSKKLTEKQKKVVKYLSENGEQSLKELCYYGAVGKSVCDRLENMGVLEYYSVECFRNPYDKAEKTMSAEDIKLTPEQNDVFLNLKGLFEGEEYEKALLFGVTGSGKTQIYLKLINEAVKSGKQAIMLVPEISLTPQTIAKFHELFGDVVAVLHSGLTMGQRLSEWKRIKEKKAMIAVGTRSAVFAPFDDIGLIIIDEEQENTYISENAPKYDARTVAMLRAKRHKALFLCASATPSVESFYEAKENKAKLFYLKNRYGNSNLPEVFVVDMLKERGRIGKSISSALAEELLYNLENNEQSILLLNRRGQNTALTCMKCGYVFECENCSVAMTYHRANRHLMCHYCGSVKELPKECPNCHEDYIRFDGAGTQKLEEELAELFPKARILRMDLDTTLKRFSHEEKLGAFKRGEYDIMIGTQMIAKGLDFPNVTLVGVLSADNSLHSPDYKAAEKAFSMFTQVVGRSGRGDKKGRAYIQTTDKENPIIALSAEQNYEGFYQNEIALRKLLLYPPFCNIYTVSFSAVREKSAEDAANWFLTELKKAAKETKGLPLRVLGPTPAPIYRKNGKYKQCLTIKCRRSKALNEMLKKLLEAFCLSAYGKDTSVSIDTNG